MAHARSRSSSPACHPSIVRRSLTSSLSIAAVALAAVATVHDLPSSARAQGETPRVRAHVHLVLLGSFRRAWIQPIADALAADLEVGVVLPEGALPLPASAYYEPRRRYRAERLTEFLSARFNARPPPVRVLGLTARDISTTRDPYPDWGILGLADIGGRAAVVSSFRMRRRARSPRHALWRMTTTAVHEVGHVLGLDHCEEPRCLMRDAEGTMDTVDAGDGRLGPGMHP